jgi:hypothetical protein
VCQEKDNEQDTPRDDQIFQEPGLLHAFLPLIYTLSTGIHIMIPFESAARKGERLNNPDFNPIEFDGFKKQSGLNSFTLNS